ncbi:MAG: acyl-CoA dehydrogenase family protein, partial [Alphaproteobacteria bacterium]
MDFSLTSEQELMRETGRRMVADDIQPVLDAHDADAPLPKAAVLEIFACFARQGLTAPRLSEKDGGAGLRMLDYGLMFESMPTMVGMALVAHEGTVARLNAESSPEQKKHLLPDLIAGQRIACTGTTEPEGGSDPRAVRTRLAHHGDEVAITGRKMWISNGSIADVMIATCVDGTDAKGRPRVTRVAVERAVSPYEAIEIPVLGLRQGHLSEIVFDDCRVPAANLLGNPGDAPQVLGGTWLVNRPLVGLLVAGLAQKALDQAVDFADQRTQFGRSIAEYQLIQERLARIATAVTTSRLLCYYALDTIDRDGDAAQLSAMAKHYPLEVCQQAISDAINVHGAM